MSQYITAKMKKKGLSRCGKSRRGCKAYEVENVEKWITMFSKKANFKNPYNRPMSRVKKAFFQYKSICSETPEFCEQSGKLKSEEIIRDSCNISGPHCYQHISVHTILQ